MKPIRRSTAKTALGLLGDVKRQVLAEPTSVDMLDIAYHVGNGTPCGTAGCIAGWCCLLTLPRERVLYSGRVPFGSRMLLASRLLGQPDTSHGWEAATPYESDVDNFFDAGTSDGISKLTPGTKQYARAVARRIDRFVKKHRARLRKTRIADVLSAAQ